MFKIGINTDDTPVKNKDVFSITNKLLTQLRLDLTNKGFQVTRLDEYQDNPYQDLDDKNKKAKNANVDLILSISTVGESIKQSKVFLNNNGSSTQTHLLPMCVNLAVNTSKVLSFTDSIGFKNDYFSNNNSIDSIILELGNVEKSYEDFNTLSDTDAIEILSLEIAETLGKLI